MKKLSLYFGVLLAFAAVLFALPVSAASETVDVTIYGMQNYDEANKVFEIINSSRAEEGKSPLVMDPVLTECAMQRAAENAVYYSHTRPNGQSCFSILESGKHGSAGENIAAGYTSAASVMNGWLNSPGHYRNIMGDYKTVGVGCFYQSDGTIFWVQLFSASSSSGTYNKSGVEYAESIPISVSYELFSENLTLYNMSGCSAMGVYQGASEDVRFQLENAGWNSARKVTLDGGYKLSVADNTIARVNEEGKLLGVATGKTKLNAKFGNVRVDIDVTVWKAPTFSVSVTDNGNHKIAWDDQGGKAYLFGKNQGDDSWSLLAYPSENSAKRTYTNSYVSCGDKWTYVLKLPDFYGYYDIGEQQVVSGGSHSYGNWKTVTKATCTQDGKRKKTCSVCGDTVTEKISAKGHTALTVAAVAPTCTESGLTAGEKCSLCGETIKAQSKVKATGHSYKTTLKKATQKANGSAVTKCTTCGKVQSTTVISKIASVSLSKTSFVYNAKTKKPTVTVKDSKGNTLRVGTDYTVEYPNESKNVGQYTVTVRFKGNYSSAKKLTFKIVPAGTKTTKLTAGKKSFDAAWKKQTTQTTGYELQYFAASDKKNAKTVTVSKNSTGSKTVKNLKSGEKYYVRIRTFKTVKVNGKNVKLYSAWSKTSSVKIK